MGIITTIGRKVFLSRQKEIEANQGREVAIQHEVLQRLVDRAAQTEYGSNHRFDLVRNYEAYAGSVPINNYNDLKGDIDRMRHGEPDILWPGKTKWFAKSSGTTSDKSKFIPVTIEGLKRIHYGGSFDVVTYYLRNNPKSRMFDGKSLILGGSHQPNYNVSDSLVGDLSSILIEQMNPIANLFRVPKKKTALLSDFEVKREKIALETLGQNITNLSGVPSWMLSVLVRALELSGKRNIVEMWPNLEVFFHGGITFTPYRKLYEDLIPKSDMHYMETYNASEGFFGIQDDPTDQSMLLLTDNDVFYEFIPVSQSRDNTSSSQAGGQGKGMPVPLEGVEKGRDYEMVITTSCGLWRYAIGDTVRFTSVNPYKFVITGRTKYFINAFGEELIMDNAEKGLAYACEQTGAEVMEYTAAPVFMDANAKCRHQWLIEFVRPPADINTFAELLDNRLQQLNSDYEAKRSHDVTLQKLEIVVAREGLFNDWLKAKGKLGGQHKIPRLSNNRKNIDELLSMNK